jgi:hypothetical protein
LWGVKKISSLTAEPTYHPLVSDHYSETPLLKHFEKLEAILADGDKFPRYPSLTVHVRDNTNDQFFENVMEDLRGGMLTIPAFEILPEGSDEPWMEPDDHDDGRYWESWDNEPGSPRLLAAKMGYGY